MARRKSRQPAARKKALQRIVAKDYGTPELSMQRLKLVEDGDPTLATCPLDCLLARQQINEVQNQAGWAYAGLHFRVYDSVFPAAGRYDELVSRGMLVSQLLEDIEREQNTWEAFQRVDRALRELGWRYHSVVHHTAVCHGWSPSWLKPLRCGLDLLARQFALDRFQGSRQNMSPS